MGNSGRGSSGVCPARLNDCHLRGGLSKGLAGGGISLNRRIAQAPLRVEGMQRGGVTILEDGGAAMPWGGTWIAAMVFT